jgi:DNA-binding MurR/RpiR family transcriptional regulator
MENTEVLIGTIATLKKNEAKIISITGFADSWIAQHSDVHLLAYSNKEGGLSR